GPFRLWMPTKLCCYRQQGREADQNVARLAGLQLCEKCGSNKDERHDQQDSRIRVVVADGCKKNYNVQKIEQREPESDFELDGIVMVTFGERPEAAGKRQQSNPRSEPHRGSALDGDPNKSANWMKLRAFVRQFSEFKVELARHAVRAVVTVQQGSDPC